MLLWGLVPASDSQNVEDLDIQTLLNSWPRKGGFESNHDRIGTGLEQDLVGKNRNLNACRHKQMQDLSRAEAPQWVLLGLSFYGKSQW